MYYFTLAAIVKNEAKYIQEFLDFYRLQGVESFYIFDNESTDKSAEILKDQGDVVYHYWPGKAKQMPAYNYVIENYQHESTWCAFLDVDEFCFSTLNKLLIDVIAQKYDRLNVSGIAVRWVLFGSNGLTEYDPRPVVERFTRCDHKVNPHCKTIARLSDTISVGSNPHVFRTCCNVVDEYMNVMPEEYAVMDKATTHILRINHYVTKSRDEYFERRKMPQACDGVIKDPEKNFPVHDCNTVENFDILKNIAALKGEKYSVNL